MNKDTGEHPLDSTDRRARRPLRGRGARIAVVVAVAAVTAGGTASALAARADEPAVTVREAGPPPTRDAMIRQWRTLLSQHGRKLPDTSSMDTAQIREGWELARMRYAEPDDAMGVSVCDTSMTHQLLDPACW